jgi:hypothetical protein
VGSIRMRSATVVAVVALGAIGVVGVGSAKGSTSAEAALAAIVRAHSTRYFPAVASPIVETRSGKLALVAYFSPRKPAYALVYHWRGGSWRLRASVDLRLTLPPDPRYPPLHVKLTGATDFTVALETANVSVLGIVSDVGGRWHAVRFEYPHTPGVPADSTFVQLYAGPPAKAISAGRITSGYDDCNPDCAAGTIHYMTWAYDAAAGMFEPAPKVARPPASPNDFVRCPAVRADKSIDDFDATFVRSTKSSPFENISAEIGTAAACVDAHHSSRSWYSVQTSSWVMLQSAPKETTSCSFFFIHCTKTALPLSFVQAGLLYHSGGVRKPDHVFAEIEYQGFHPPSVSVYEDRKAPQGGLVIHNEGEGVTVEFGSAVSGGQFGVAVLPTVYRSFDPQAQQCPGDPSDATKRNIQGAKPSAKNPEYVVETELNGNCLWDFFLPTKVASSRPLVWADLAAEVHSTAAAVPGTYSSPLTFSDVLTETTGRSATAGFHPVPTGTAQDHVEQVGCQAEAGAGSSYVFSVWARTESRSCGG